MAAQLDEGQIYQTFLPVVYIFLAPHQISFYTQMSLLFDSSYPLTKKFGTKNNIYSSL